jgi:hypothetical protein
MAKKAPSKPQVPAWTLQIEFTGLLVAEPFFKQKKMIVHLIDDPLHVPAFTARLRDLKGSEDCVPTYTLQVTECDSQTAAARDSATHPVTIGAWPIRRGAAMSIPPNKTPFDLDIPHQKPKPGECSSISTLANLKDLLSARRCQPNSDDPTFLLTHGGVTAGNCNPELEFTVLVGGREKFKGNLALSLIYRLEVTVPIITIDLHPGKVTVGPPETDDRISPYVVATTITNFPTPHLAPDDPPHFMEYNRIAGTDLDIEVRVRHVDGQRFIEDPIHCVPASLSA